MHHSRTDLDGLKVTAEDFLAAVLDSAAQPIWAVDAAGLIRFANPAAVEALGYDDAQELLGRNSHETIHYAHPDGKPYPACDCPMLLPRVTGETVTSELDWFFRRDGSMFPVSYVSVPVELPEGRGAVVAFTDIEERLRAEQSAARARCGAGGARGLAAADRHAGRRRGGIAGGVRRHREGGGSGAGRGNGGDLALRTRPPRERGRRVERSTAPIPGRHQLAGGRAHGRRPPPRAGPSQADRGLRRHRRRDRRGHQRDRDPLGRRHGDRGRRRALGHDGCGGGGGAAIGGPDRGSARRVHGTARHGDLHHRESSGALPAGRRAGRAAARRDAVGTRRASERAVRCRRARRSAAHRCGLRDGDPLRERRHGDRRRRRWAAVGDVTDRGRSSLVARRGARWRQTVARTRASRPDRRARAHAPTCERRLGIRSSVGGPDRGRPGRSWGALYRALVRRRARCPRTPRSVWRTSPTWSPRPSPTPRRGPMCNGSPRSRPRCAASPRWSRASRLRRRSSPRSPKRWAGSCTSRTTKLVRFEPDATATVMASWGQARGPDRGRHELEPGRGQRDRDGLSHGGAPRGSTTTRMRTGPLAAYLHSVGVRSAVATPVMVGRAALGRDDRLLAKGRAAARRHGVVHRASSPRSSPRRSRTSRRTRIWRRHGRGSWRRPTRSAGGWSAICTTGRSRVSCSR